MTGIFDADVDTSPIRPEELLEARTYAIIIEWYAKDGVYLVTAPDLPGWYYSNQSLTDAVELGQEGVAVWLSGLRDLGEDVPRPQYSNLPSYLRDDALVRSSASVV